MQCLCIYFFPKRSNFSFYSENCTPLYCFYSLNGTKASLITKLFNFVLGILCFCASSITSVFFLPLRFSDSFLDQSTTQTGTFLSFDFEVQISCFEELALPIFYTYDFKSIVLQFKFFREHPSIVTWVLSRNKDQVTTLKMLQFLFRDITTGDYPDDSPSKIYDDSSSNIILANLTITIIPTNCVKDSKHPEKNGKVPGVFTLECWKTELQKKLCNEPNMQSLSICKTAIHICFPVFLFLYICSDILITLLIFSHIFLLKAFSFFYSYVKQQFQF